MNIASLAVQDLALNFMVVASFGFAFVIFTLNQKCHFIKSRHELKFNYLLLTAVVTLSATQTLLPKKEFFKPPFKVWSAATDVNFGSEFSVKNHAGYVNIGPLKKSVFIGTGTLTLFFGVTLILMFITALFRLLKDLTNLRRLAQKAFLVRKFGRVKVISSDAVQVPFSFTLGRWATVVLPNAMLGRQSDCNIAIFHELQHHRQRDTLWVHALWFVQVACSLNPAFYLWKKLISEVQEFACDEALVDRKKVSPSAYASCLIRVAQTAITSRPSFACATGLSFKTDRHVLKRRIYTMMMNKPRVVVMRKSLIAFVALTVGATLTGIAMASQGVLQDRRVDLAAAEKMLIQVKPNSKFRVVINDLVLKELNHYVGTPDGRDFIQKSLDRMQNYRDLVSADLKGYGVPEDLIAIPIVESGYQNLAQSTHHVGAGLWMFIASTAKQFGLRVNGQTDDRLDVELSTDAAMRYLTANHLRFNSWELAVLAYNMGESKVQQAIDATGSKDPFVLIKAGYEGDPGYLAKVMAAILIKNNPSVVR